MGLSVIPGDASLINGLYWDLAEEPRPKGRTPTSTFCLKTHRYSSIISSSLYLNQWFMNLTTLLFRCHCVKLFNTFFIITSCVESTATFVFPRKTLIIALPCARLNPPIHDEFHHPLGCRKR